MKFWQKVLSHLAEEVSSWVRRLLFHRDGAERRQEGYISKGWAPNTLVRYSLNHNTGEKLLRRHVLVKSLDRESAITNCIAFLKKMFYKIWGQRRVITNTCQKIRDSRGTLRPLSHNKTAFCIMQRNTTRSDSAETQFASPLVSAIDKEVQLPNNS